MRIVSNCDTDTPNKRLKVAGFFFILIEFIGMETLPIHGSLILSYSFLKIETYAAALLRLPLHRVRWYIQMSTLFIAGCLSGDMGIKQ